MDGACCHPPLVDVPHLMAREPSSRAFSSDPGGAVSTTPRPSPARTSPHPSPHARLLLKAGEVLQEVLCVRQAVAHVREGCYLMGRCI